MDRDIVMDALSDLRVIDLSTNVAGPFCTKLFADMGAEILKMESLSVYDSHRGPVSPARGIAAYPDGEPGEEPWNRNGWFNCLHMSKYGVTLELTEAEGRRVFERLVSVSDVLIENFRQGSLERLGYTYEELRKHRPDLIYVSMPAFGNTGPWKSYLGYGIGQEQLSGMAHMTGYRGEGPMKSGINHGDPITGSHAAGVLMAALRHRRRTGKGMYIDVSQQESAVSLIGAEVLAYQMTGDIDQAGETQRKALSLLPPEESPTRTELETKLGEYLVEQGSYAEAQTLLLNGYNWMKENWRGSADRIHEIIERIVKLYESWNAADPGKGYADKAAKWRAKLASTQPATQPAAVKTP